MPIFYTKLAALLWLSRNSKNKMAYSIEQLNTQKLAAISAGDTVKAAFIQNLINAIRERVKK
jgi:hypothetical protein